MADSIVIIGGGGHAKVLVSMLKKLDYQVLGYTDPADNGHILGVPYLGGDDALPGVIARNPACLAAIGLGKIDASAGRRVLARRVLDLGFTLPAIVSPEAIVNEAVELGDGTVVFDGAIVNSGTTVGALCILNTHCTVEHDCRLSDNVHVAPGATISGGVSVGTDAMLGVGCAVLQDVTIEAGCLIGAGSTVIADLSRAGVYVGSPARRIG
jgi:UDP-perosamine 4-acetyltransferase